VLAIVHLCAPEASSSVAGALGQLGAVDVRLSVCGESELQAAMGAWRPAEPADGPVGTVAAEARHFLSVLQDADLGVYDLVVKLRAASADEAERLVDAMLGSDVVGDVWGRFRRDPFAGLVDTGMTLPVGPDAAEPVNTAAAVSDLIGPHDVTPPSQLSTWHSFWTKPAAMAKLRRLNPDRLKAYGDETLDQILPALVHSAVVGSGYRTVNTLSGPTGPAQGVRIGGREVKLIAFYLPQFHPIPENDQWWGPSFTEWTSVTRARPMYKGHPQPRLPARLGFYDLRVAETRQAQADLASEHGIFGFCYYYYWFDGRHVLERPLQEVLATGKPDFPFCICWANENWTRRWDGLDNEVLLRQAYSPDSSRRFIRDVIPILSDHRYIRYEGRPLLVVYRVRDIPDLGDTLAIWRRECRQAGLGEIHIAGVRFWDAIDLRSLGFDAAVDFPPHHVAVRSMNDKVPNLVPNFNGLIYDYEHLVRQNLQSLGHGYEQLTHRGVMLAWDNTPRRGLDAHIAHGARPELYTEWLRGVIKQEMEHNRAPESLIFINAWNEWGEGANLEPDTEFGDGFLRATKDVLADLTAGTDASAKGEATVDDGERRQFDTDR
jgi:hypothetical protein